MPCTLRTWRRQPPTQRRPRKPRMRSPLRPPIRHRQPRRRTRRERRRHRLTRQRRNQPNQVIRSVRTQPINPSPPRAPSRWPTAPPASPNANAQADGASRARRDHITLGTPPAIRPRPGSPSGDPVFRALSNRACRFQHSASQRAQLKLRGFASHSAILVIAQLFEHTRLLLCCKHRVQVPFRNGVKHKHG